MCGCREALISYDTIICFQLAVNLYRKLQDQVECLGLCGWGMRRGLDGRNWCDVPHCGFAFAFGRLLSMA